MTWEFWSRRWRTKAKAKYLVVNRTAQGEGGQASKRRDKRCGMHTSGQVRTEMLNAVRKVLFIL